MVDQVDTSISRLEIYKLQSLRFTNLNDTLYKIPPIFGTVIGGLWYFAAQQMPTQRTIPAMAFVLAGMVSICGLVAISRLRGYMTAYLDNLAQFEAPHAIPRSIGTSTAKAILWLMYVTAGLSCLGVLLAFLQQR
jgi:hypothetical protein